MSDGLCPAPPRCAGGLGPYSPPSSCRRARLSALAFFSSQRMVEMPSLTRLIWPLWRFHPPGAGSWCGLQGQQPCVCLTWGCGNSHKTGPNKVPTDQVAGSSLPEVGNQKASWEREPWRVGGMQVCRSRFMDRKTDLGGTLRAKARFAHFDILLLQWETKDSLWVHFLFSTYVD